MTPEQVELARRNIELRSDIDGKVLGQDIQALLDDARNSALEEAAEVADEWAEKFEGQTDFADFGPLMRNFAAAIREKIK